MSAITGIFYRDGCHAGYDQINKMNDCLSHRGPDGGGVWAKGSVALGHQMLHTTPESLTETLPFYDETSGMIITADARIDNRAELSPLLGLENKIHIPDSQFILKAYQKWDEKCPEKLLGDFAFAIWDIEKNQLFCARDHMGVKPFYYYLCDEKFYFATEIKALLNLEGIKKELNELKIALHLSQFDDQQSTFIKDIFRLPAAHSLTITSSKIKLNKYWELDAHSEIKMDSEGEYIKEFQKIFTESVKCRLRSALPLGFELSGGLDSSSITCTAKEIFKKMQKLPNDINTFSIVFRGSQVYNDEFYIKEVLKYGQIESHFVYGDNINPLENIEKILCDLDEPFFLKNTVLSWNLYEKMRENNIRIFLSGHDGDTVVSDGEYYFKELALTLKYLKLIKEINYTSKIIKDNIKYIEESNSIYFKTYYNNFQHILLKKVIFPLFFPLIIPIIPGFLKKIIRPLFKKEYVRYKPDTYTFSKYLLNKYEFNNYLKEKYIEPINNSCTPKKYHFFNINSFIHQYTLEFIDRSAALFNLEPRFPFYDKRLIEFCYAIPTEMKYKNGWSRYILRQAMQDVIPKQVQWRIFKQDFDPTFQHNFLLFGRKILDEILSEEKHIIYNYIDYEKFKKIYENYKSVSNRSGIADSLGVSSDINDLWIITMLYLWFNELYKS